MTPKKAQAELDPQEELVRLLALQIRLQLGNQREAIVQLNKVGFGPSRIAGLLGTTPGTVATDLKRAKKG